jgi:arabinosyltransferase C
MVKIMAYLNGLSGRRVLIAPPGVPSPAFSEKTQEDGVNLTPAVPDLNPVASGLTGVYTYAGHWSETPDYPKRRAVLQRIYYADGGTPEQRRDLVKSIGANYAIALVPSAAPVDGLPDLRSLGDVVVNGSKYVLVRVR